MEQEELEITEEALIVMLAMLTSTQTELEKELRNFYQKYGKDGVVTYSEARKWVSGEDHRRRLTVLLLFLHDSFQKTLSNISPTFESMVKDVIGKETKFFDVEVDVDKVAFMEWGTDKDNWLDRLDDNVSLWEYNIASDLKRSLLKRENIDKVLERMDKRFDSIERVISKLTLTESTAVGSLARREIFKELGVTKYRYYTMEDERTCEVCGELHGKTFPISAYEVGVTASPMHPFADASKFQLRT